MRVFVFAPQGETVKLMRSAPAFARTVDVKIAINDVGFVVLHPMAVFFPIDHANFALKGP